MARYTVRPLGPDTWDPYATLIERHNGVWGGCWCLAFHPKHPDRGQSLEGNRALKRRLVEAYPQDTKGARVSAPFLYNGTRGRFERAGFTFDRPKGKNHRVMRAVVGLSGSGGSTARRQPGRSSDLRPVGDLPDAIGKTAARELALQGITSLRVVAEHSERELLAIHGVGPKAVSILGAALTEAGLAFRDG